MKTERSASPAQKEAGRNMRELAGKFALKPAPFPIKVRPLRLGLGVGTGFCRLPGKKIAIGFASGRRLAPIAIAEGESVRPTSKLLELVKGVGEITFRPDDRGGKYATIADSFGYVMPIGQMRKEGEKWGLFDLRCPLPKPSLTSLSWPQALATLFMGSYLPSVLSGFPLCAPTASVAYHFFGQNAGSAISSVTKEAMECGRLRLSSSGFEIAARLAIKESGVEKALGGGLESVSSSMERDLWTFSSPLQDAEKPLKKFESFLNLAFFAANSSANPFGFWQFLDAMEKALEDPLSQSPFREAPAMAQFAARAAEKLSRGALDPEGEWVARAAFAQAANSIRLPLPVDFSLSFSPNLRKAALVVRIGGSWKVPEFLAPHPLGRRRLMLLFSLAASKALCAAAFGAAGRLEEVDLYVEAQDFPPRAARALLLAKGSFLREEFLRPGRERNAEEFFASRFKGDLARSPYFSPMPSEKEWLDSPFNSPLRRKPPEFSWEELPAKFAPALGTSFIADLSMDRKLILIKALSTFQSIYELVRSGKMGREEGEEKAASICRLMPDPEIVRAGSDFSFLDCGVQGRPGLEGDLEVLRREAARLAGEEGRVLEAVRLLERGAKEAEEGFDLDPMAPSRYFHSYLERVVYNKLLASRGEYTVLLPDALFAIHLELEELLAKRNDPGALEHANWQVLHAPATPLSHLNQYKELSAAKDWEAAKAAAMNMLEVSVEASQLAIAYRNLGYCFWMEGDMPLASALYRMAGSIDGKEEMIRAEGRLLEASARSSHIPLPSETEFLDLIKERSVPAYPDLPAITAARRAAEALVDCGLFLPASGVLRALSGLPGFSADGQVASALFSF